MLTTVDTGRAAEVGLIGPEGMIGVPMALGVAVSPSVATDLAQRPRFIELCGAGPVGGYLVLCGQGRHHQRRRQRLFEHRQQDDLAMRAKGS